MGQTQSAGSSAASAAATASASTHRSTSSLAVNVDDSEPLKTTWHRIKLRLRTGDLILFKSARPSPVEQFSLTQLCVIGSREGESLPSCACDTREREMMSPNKSENALSPRSSLNNF